jgi:hypothetical protein
MQNRVTALVAVRHLVVPLPLLLRLVIKAYLVGQRAKKKCANTNLKKAGDWGFVVIVDQLYVAYIKVM